MILRFITLERDISAYFDRQCYVADRSVDEKLVVAAIEQLPLKRTDVHKGIKVLWENGFMDSPRAKYKKPISLASEAMDEERGIREYNPELFEKLLEAPLLNTLFVIPDGKGCSVETFLVDPSKGYIAFSSYTTTKGDTDLVVHKILEHNQ